MGVRSQLRGFLRAFRSGSGRRRRPEHRGDVVAKAVDDAMHPTAAGGLIDRSPVYDQIADGADAYTKSFEDE